MDVTMDARKEPREPGALGALADEVGVLADALARLEGVLAPVTVPAKLSMAVTGVEQAIVLPEPQTELRAIVGRVRDLRERVAWLSGAVDL